MDAGRRNVMTPPARPVRTPSGRSTTSTKIATARITPPSARRVEPYKPTHPSSPPRAKSPCASRPVTSRLATVSTAAPVVKNAPILPVTAKAKFGAHLSQYEEKEIMKYDEIYYIGPLSKKIKTNTSSAVNYGFDFSTHHYRVTVGDQIAYRYEIKAVLGKGAFGQVLRCFDHKTKENVALKIIINTPQMTEQGKREMEILSSLNELDISGTSHIVRLLDTFVFRKHVCAAFEVLGQNLYEFQRANFFKPISLRHVRVMARQILKALMFTHNNGFVHCDMKPENILLVPGSSSRVRVIDFGSACSIGQKHFDYIQSRFYRAPEVILGMKYGPPMDIWSLGCIIGELVTGKPIFAGETESQQIQLFIAALGLPPEKIIKSAPRRSVFFDETGKPKAVNGKRKKPGGSSIAKITRVTDPELLDFLSKCLEWDQNQRITAEEALNHPFFQVREAPASPTKQTAVCPKYTRGGDTSPRSRVPRKGNH